MSKPVTALTDSKVVNLSKACFMPNSVSYWKEIILRSVSCNIFVFRMPSGICDAYIESEG